MSDYELYDDLPLEDPLLDALARQGYQELEPDQAELLQHLLAGRDLLADATGRDADLALAITALDRVDPADDRVQVLVVTPTDEETVKFAARVNPLGQENGLEVFSILEGSSLGRELQGLKRKPAIIAGTIGPLLEHLDRGTLESDAVQLVIIDRLDAIIELGQQAGAEKLLSLFPADGDVQKVITVSTLDDTVRRLSWRTQARPRHHFPGETPESGSGHEYYPVLDTTRFNTLCAWLDMELKEGEPRGVLVFTRPGTQMQDVVYSLNLNGFEAEALDSGTRREEQERIIQGIREGGAALLVSSDAVFPEMPLEDFSHIIHFQIPDHAEAFADRLRRAADLGFAGKSVSLITSHEHPVLVKTGSMAGESVEYGEYDLDDYLGDYRFKRDMENRGGGRDGHRFVRHRPDIPDKRRTPPRRDSRDRGPAGEGDPRRERGRNRGGDSVQDDEGYMKFRTSHGGRKFTYRYRFVG